MKKVLLFISMLLAAVLITSLYSCTQDGGDNDNRHRQGNENGENVNLEKACESLQEVSDIYMECRSIEELQNHVDEITKIDNVEKVYFSDIAMFVKVKDFMTVSFCFYPEVKSPQIEQLDIPQVRQAGTRASSDNSFSQLGFEKAVIIDQQVNDRNWDLYTQGIKGMLDRVGIKTEINKAPTIEYLRDGLFDNDIVLFISHGHYDSDKKLHWLDLQNLEEFDWRLYPQMSLGDYLTNDLILALGGSVFVENDMLQITITQKWKTFRYVPYACFSVSEKFISSIQKKFKKQGKALVFNVACQSLMAGDNTVTDQNQHDFAFAQAFIDRGAGVYFGYDEINGAGQMAGMLLLGSIASGQSVKSAFNSLPDAVVHNQMDDGDEEKQIAPTRFWTADLFYYPEDHFDIENCCQVFPTLEEKEESDKNIILKSSEPYNLMFYKGDKIDDKYTVTGVYPFIVEPVSDYESFARYEFTYGYEVSTTKDFTSSHTKVYEMQFNRAHVNNYALSDDDYILHFSYPVPKSDLESETTYYYRAYLNDGTNKYFSDYDTFTTPKQERIDQVIPEDIREQMEPFIPIYDGNNPPTIEGVFVIDSPEVVHDTTNNYKKGDTGFTPIYLRFLNQDFMNNTLDYEERDVYNGKVVGESSGPGAFISGEGNNFSVFFSTTGVNHYDKYDISIKTSLVISGTKTDSGIQDVRYAFVLTDKGPDPDHHVMDKGGFRVFKDSDDFASKATWPSGARSWGWDYHVKDGKITTPWSIYAVRK